LRLVAAAGVDDEYEVGVSVSSISLKVVSDMSIYLSLTSLLEKLE